MIDQIGETGSFRAISYEGSDRRLESIFSDSERKIPLPMEFASGVFNDVLAKIPPSQPAMDYFLEKLIIQPSLLSLPLKRRSKDSAAFL